MPDASTPLSRADVPGEVFDRCLALVQGFADRAVTVDRLTSYLVMAGLDPDDLGEALAVAYAAGRESAYEGGKTQWGIRRVGFKSVRVTDERRARSLLRGWVVPGELVTRRIPPWTVAE